MPSLRNMMIKVAFVVVFPVLIGIGLDLTLPLPTFLGLEDAALFSLSFYALARYWPRTAEAFTSNGPIDSAQALTLAIFWFSISFILAVVWSVRWRASGHMQNFGEDDLRGAFRGAAVIGTIWLVVSQGPYETRLPPRRWITVAALLVAALSIVCLALYSDAIRSRFTDLIPRDAHDLAPPPGIDYVP